MDVNVLLHSWLGQLAIVVVGAPLIAWAAFQWLGKKWLESQFAESLERFKHAQNAEIERLRYRINALMDRTTKLHQNEFEVLPEAWDRLMTSFSDAQRFTSRLTTRADLDRMDENELNTFLENSRLHQWQRDKIFQLPRGHKNQQYGEMKFWHDLQDVAKSHGEFHNYFLSKGIFIQPDLKEKFRNISTMIFEAYRERQLDKEMPIPGEGRLNKGDILQSDGPAMLKDIEREVQSRLWEANKLD